MQTPRDEEYEYVEGACASEWKHDFQFTKKLAVDICVWCKNQIDPDVCHCGSDYASHKYEEHCFVPMGCDCGRAREPASERNLNPYEMLAPIDHIVTVTDGEGRVVYDGPLSGLGEALAKARAFGQPVEDHRPDCHKCRFPARKMDLSRVYDNSDGEPARDWECAECGAELTQIGE